jgi:hypothetical protein
MAEPLFETGRGTKALIGLLILSASILASAFGMGMQIQKLIIGLTTVTDQHRQILDMKPCKQN